MNTHEILRSIQLAWSFQNLLKAVEPIPNILLTPKQHKFPARMMAVQRAEDKLQIFFDVLDIEPRTQTLPLEVLANLLHVVNGKFDRMSISGTKIKVFEDYIAGLYALSQCNSLHRSTTPGVDPNLNRVIRHYNYMRGGYKDSLKGGTALPPFIAHMSEYISYPFWEATSPPNLIIDALLRMMTGLPLFENGISISFPQQAIFTESYQNVAVRFQLAASTRFYRTLRSPNRDLSTQLKAFQKTEIALNGLCFALRSIIETGGGNITEEMVDEINIIFNRILSRIGFGERGVLHKYHQGLASQMRCQPPTEIDPCPRIDNRLEPALRDLQARRRQLEEQGHLPPLADHDPRVNNIRACLLAILWDRIDSILHPR